MRTLTADEANSVLRPLNSVITDTSAQAVFPALADLKAPFLLKLQRAEEQANEILDGILTDRTSRMIVRMDLGLSNRIMADETDVDALVNEIRARLLDQIRAGNRVRLQ